MVEDAPRDMLVSIYALSTVAGLLAGFVSPLTSVLVGRFSLVSTMRGLYLFAFVSITLKAILLYHYSRETSQGQVRMAELKGKPFSLAFKGSGRVLKQTLQNRPLMLVLGLMAAIMVVRGAMDNFWPLLVTGNLGIKEEALPLLATLKSLVMLLCFFLLSHRLRMEHYLRPLRLGFGLMLAMFLMLLFLPRGLSFAVVLGVLVEALALSILLPLSSSLQMLLLDEGERARMFGLSLSFCLLITAPFGAINGFLSRLHLALPMAVCALMMALALFLLSRLQRCLPEGCIHSEP